LRAATEDPGTFTKNFGADEYIAQNLVVPGIVEEPVLSPDFRNTDLGDWTTLPVQDAQGNSWDSGGDPEYFQSGTDYTSMTAWEADAPDWDTNHTVWKGVVSDNAEYNENIQLVSSGTASLAAHFWLTVAPANRHSGKAGTTHARLRGNTNGSHVLTITDGYARVEYLEIQQDSTGGSDEGIRVTTGVEDPIINACIIWSDTDTDDQDGIYAHGSYPVSGVNISNCIIYGFRRAQINLQQFSTTPTTSRVNVDHCTLIYQSASAPTTPNQGGIFIWSNGLTDQIVMNVYNTIGYMELSAFEAFADGDGGAGTGNRDVPDGATWNGSHNLSGDQGTHVEIDGTDNLTNWQEATDGDSEVSQPSGSYIVFKDITVGTEDFTLLDGAAGNLAIGNGVNRQGFEPDPRQDFSIDILGKKRSKIKVDIGAHALSQDAAPPFRRRQLTTVRM
jgi:hypothetical protein